VSELKALRPRSLPARRSVKELVADGFEERQRIRDERRRRWNEKYNKAAKKALADQRSSAFPTAKAPEHPKLPTYKQAAGGTP
jgi:hypothetical protein